MDWLNPDIIAYDKVRVFVDHDFPGYKNVYSFGDFTVILKDGTKEFAYGPPLDHICSVSFRGLMKKACQVATKHTQQRLHLGTNKDLKAFKAVL